MKRAKLVISHTDDSKALFEAREVVRKFKFAFPGTPEKNQKNYRAAKKTVAQLLAKNSASVAMSDK
jgi:hypothetical protein